MKLNRLYLLLVMLLGTISMTVAQTDSTEINNSESTLGEVLNPDTTTILNYPHYSIENGDTVVVITIEQAQKIDSDLELLELLKAVNLDYKSSDTINIRVINQLEEKVETLEFKVEDLIASNNKKDTIINKLEASIVKYQDNEVKYEKELANKDQIIDEKDQQIKKHKNRQIWGGVAMGASIIVLTTLLIVK